MTGQMRGSRWRIAGWGVAAGLILLPLVAMWFTGEVNWGVEDFVFACVLVGGVGLAYELAVRTTRSRAYRTAAAVALAAAFLMIWINLAVGIIGSEDNPANLMYFGVLAIGFLGAIIAELRPHGMARTLFAMALAQAVVPVMALIVGKPQITSEEALMGVAGVLTLNGFFVVLFVGSALLFRSAARQLTPGARGRRGDLRR